MKSICADVFRAVNEGKWLSIEYQNNKGERKTFWIGIENIDRANGTITCRAMRLKASENFPISPEGEPFRLSLSGILTATVIDGSYFPENEALVRSIEDESEEWGTVFPNVPNLKTLTYLEMCNKLDSTSYVSKFELVRLIDRDVLEGGELKLTDEQFAKIVDYFQMKADAARGGRVQYSMQRLAINALSVRTSRGLYVLAYKDLRLDVVRRTLRAGKGVQVCSETALDFDHLEDRISIRRYLDDEDAELLSDFEKNAELIKDKITQNLTAGECIDDLPHIMGIGRSFAIDLHSEYQAILDRYSEGAGNVSAPIRAFFGEITRRPRGRAASPIMLLDGRVNLDQLLAIDTAMRLPVTYVQGPPGSGKTNTIINTILTAFFNKRTVLFSSYNNHPIDSVFEKLTSMEYRGSPIPFCVLRLGNTEKQKAALEYIRCVYEGARDVKVFEGTLDKDEAGRAERAAALSGLLAKYYRILDFRERRETIQTLLEKGSGSLSSLEFEANLRQQLSAVEEEIKKAGTVTDDDARALLDTDYEGFKKWLCFTSVRRIKLLDRTEFDDLRAIVYENDEDTKLEKFAAYLSDSENVRRLLKVFPVIITTCISAHKIGRPEPLFDMTIIDEASQCNNAVSLVPIIRGGRLMLVGDVRQLNPVILLDDAVNQKLRRMYDVSDAYDYKKMSIYKTYLACDSVSREILLSHHYRCHKKIIDFGNKKFYNSRLVIDSNVKSSSPLVHIDVHSEGGAKKNTSYEEVDKVVELVKANKGKSIGVITPFRNQKEEIQTALEASHLDVPVGTVHAFQGDEKDVIIFSCAITDQTRDKTYKWINDNPEIINVASSRAKESLVVISDSRNLERLHKKGTDDDLYELVNYAKTNGESYVSEKKAASRALGLKPYSSQTEDAFLETLGHALECVLQMQNNHYRIDTEVAVSALFDGSTANDKYFYMGRFDFVIFDRRTKKALLAIELDGKEHHSDDVVKARDEKKKRICREHNFELIRVENSYARRYNYIKNILREFFK